MFRKEHLMDTSMRSLLFIYTTLYKWGGGVTGYGESKRGLVDKSIYALPAFAITASHKERERGVSE
jgi:hypothetical protein